MTDNEVYEIKALLDDLSMHGKLNKDLTERITNAKFAFEPVYENARKKAIRNKYEELRFNYNEFSPMKEAMKIINATNGAISLLEAAEHDLSVFDKATQDILHALEMSELSTEDELKLTEDLKEIRQSRRRCKNFIEMVSPLTSFSCQHKGTFDKVNKIYAEMQKIKCDIEGRKYYPRVRKDLETVFAQANNTYMSFEGIAITQ